jgi:hypothetical protein
LAGAGILVSAPSLIGEFLADLAALEASAADELLPLERASLESGYSKAHLRRLAGQGKIQLHGSRYRPRIRRGDLPQKPSRDEIPRYGGAA